jgi:hypothetical protein
LFFNGDYSIADTWVVRAHWAPAEGQGLYGRGTFPITDL